METNPTNRNGIINDGVSFILVGSDGDDIQNRTMENGKISRLSSNDALIGNNESDLLDSGNGNVVLNDNDNVSVDTLLGDKGNYSLGRPGSNNLLNGGTRKVTIVFWSRQ